MAYHLNPNRRCHVCWRYGLDPEHLKSCIPRRYWPQETETAAGEQSITVIATTEGEESPRVSAVICDCGYMAKTASGLRLHRMKAKQHQPVPLPNGEFLPEAS